MHHRQAVAGIIISGAVAIVIFLAQYQVKVMPSWAFSIGYSLCGLTILISVLAFFPVFDMVVNASKRVRLQSPIVYKTNKGEHMPESANKERPTLPSPQERELLELYKRQKDNWKNYIRLNIIGVSPRVTSDSPKITFELEVRNYLPIAFKLVKVTKSSGNISAGALGSCALPALPETVDEEFPPSTEKQFTIDLAVHGTGVPKFLQSVSNPGQLLQWMLKGEWYVEIYGKMEVWQYQAYEIRYDQIIRCDTVVTHRGM